METKNLIKRKGFNRDGSPRKPRAKETTPRPTRSSLACLKFLKPGESMIFGEEDSSSVTAYCSHLGIKVKTSVVVVIDNPSSPCPSAFKGVKVIAV